jgi:glyceraldehyde-3-phosphate dehydrogenase/erythrose-4-phosphate dehydrogenase
VYRPCTPGAVDWDGAGVELVLECSGQFVTRESLVGRRRLKPVFASTE